jgi:hypothetical protein
MTFLKQIFILKNKTLKHTYEKQNFIISDLQ